jgi:hypothetical protein
MFVTRARPALTALLVDTLDLPLVWPSAGDDWTASSGVTLGNLNLEIMGTQNVRPSFMSSLAFEPQRMETLIGTLDAMGVPRFDPAPGPPMPGRTDSSPRWTIVSARGLGRGVFFIRYHGFDMAERRARFQLELERRRGGRLGVVRVREVVVRLAAPDSVAPAWERLLGPAQDAGGRRWLISDGLAVRLAARDDPDADALIVEVRSVGEAARALDALGIGNRLESGGLRVDPDRFAGLRLILVSSREP